MIQRACAAILALLWATAPVSARPHPHVKARAIAVVINGNTLSIDPPPRFAGSVLVVPVRAILSSLGLPFAMQHGNVETQVADRTVLLHKRDAVELKGVLYAPLRFFSAALGGQAVYDAKASRVVISSSLVGASASIVSQIGRERLYMGVVQAIDNDSSPPSITVSSGPSVKTIKISNGARFLINDVVANVTVPGALEDVHVGDYAKIAVNNDGRIERVVSQYASRHGKIAAISGNTIVLADGHVITPSGITALSLNAQGAKVSELQIGDDADVRYNLETSEVREIIATRRAVGTPAPQGAVAIASIEPSTSRALRQGESFDVVMHGTPGGTATYDVGEYFQGLPMTENTAGTYSARFTIPKRANFSAAAIFGHLSVHGVDASRAQSLAEISASNSLPGIIDYAPQDGQTVNNDQPSIYATFVPDATAINPSSIQLIINGHDVTASAVRSATFVEYHPLLTYSNGRVNVTVRVADAAGNVATKSWSFSIRTH